MRAAENTKSVSWPSILLLVGLMLIAVFLLTIEIRHWQNRVALNAEVDKLKAEEAKARAENLSFQDLLQYMQTSDYRERVAKEQLHLQKAGETVYRDASANTVSSESDSAPVKVFNPKLWWQYFFSSDRLSRY